MITSLFKKAAILTLAVSSLTVFASAYSSTVYADDEFSDSQPEMTQDVDDAEYDKTIAAFHQAPQSAAFFDNSYGYAVFPTIGKVGFVIGGAYGKGRVYEHGRLAGTAEMTQATIGFQLGGQAFSQIIFFQDQRAYDEFTSGNFEFGAQASAIVINAGANAEASTKGTSASANAGERHVKADGQYYKGMAVFSLAKGGLMYEATIGGQKYNFYPN
ncbi:lipid-binding SYLF domain-containing protein [Thiomicrorhabdus sp.]|uniref:lipid-binding SYLF domain-containing protein n=1 Tax=Thiomicrorhabdus sp. TaxID=2039724 RepID=UPI002AA81893|nr:lipid-binding SYLF domain-containing protein [Thiomicrorhabdus sp.]